MNSKCVVLDVRLASVKDRQRKFRFIWIMVHHINVELPLASRFQSCTTGLQVTPFHENQDACSLVSPRNTYLRGNQKCQSSSEKWDSLQDTNSRHGRISLAERGWLNRPSWSLSHNQFRTRNCIDNKEYYILPFYGILNFCSRLQEPDTFIRNLEHRIF